ncbi:MAG: Rnf-Nqr domain containing protein [Planctomycetota bacterium]
MQSHLLSPFVIFFASIFTSNILLANFLGMCSFISVSKELKAAAGLGLAVTFVMTATNALNYLVYYYLLVPLGLEYLRFIAFIVVIAAFVQLVEMVIDRVSPTLYYALGIFLPLITVNCAIFGANLFMLVRAYDFWRSVAYGAGSGLGWTLAILALAGIRRKIKPGVVPDALFGPALAFVITGIMAMAFTGFTGMIPIE